MGIESVLFPRHVRLVRADPDPLLILLQPTTETITLHRCDSFSVTRSGQVAQFRVQTGTDMVDHVTEGPLRISIQAAWTDTPSFLLAGFSAVSDAAKSLIRPRSAAVVHLNKVFSWKGFRTPIKVITSDSVYEDMMIESVERTDDAPISEVRASITLVEARTVSLEFNPLEADIEAKLAGSQGTEELGQQALTPDPSGSFGTFPLAPSVF